MTVNRPFRRTCRQFTDGSYSEGGRWQYLLHRKFSKDPQHYIRAFLLLQQDLIELFAYIEPASANFKTYSHRVQQLLTRTCIEVEANLTAILVENGYKKTNGYLTMRDYKLVNHSHRLSSYQARIPGWHGTKQVWQPYAAWESGGSLKWYKAYNDSKHSRHESFHLATFEALVTAMCGLVVLLSAQFKDEDYSPREKSLSIGSAYSYDTNDGMNSAIGGYFRIRFPEDWPTEERYEFDWNEIKKLDDPFIEFDHSACAQ